MRWGLGDGDEVGVVDAHLALALATLALGVLQGLVLAIGIVRLQHVRVVALGQQLGQELVLASGRRFLIGRAGEDGEGGQR